MSNAIKNETVSADVAQPGVKQTLPSGAEICIAASTKCFSLYGYGFGPPINLSKEAAQDLLQDLDHVVSFLQTNLDQVMDQGARKAAKSLEKQALAEQRRKESRAQEIGKAATDEEAFMKKIAMLKQLGIL
jgi:hypothetical protein